MFSKQSDKSACWWRGCKSGTPRCF